MNAAEWGPADGFAVALLAVAIGLYTSLAILFALLTVPVGLVSLAVSGVQLLDSRADARRAAEWARMSAAERAAVLRRYGSDAERAAVELSRLEVTR